MKLPSSTKATLARATQQDVVCTFATPISVYRHELTNQIAMEHKPRHSKRPTTVRVAEVIRGCMQNSVTILGASVLKSPRDRAPDARSME